MLEEFLAYVLIGISLLTAQYERSLRTAQEKDWYACSSGVYEAGSAEFFRARIVNDEECVRVRENPTPRLVNEVLNWVKDTLLSGFLDIPGDVLGLYAGIRLAGGKPPKLREILLKRDDGM